MKNEDEWKKDEKKFFLFYLMVQAWNKCWKKTNGNEFGGRENERNQEKNQNSFCDLTVSSIPSPTDKLFRSLRSTRIWLIMQSTSQRFYVFGDEFFLLFSRARWFANEKSVLL